MPARLGSGRRSSRGCRPYGPINHVLLLLLALTAAGLVDRAAALGEAQGYVADARGTYKKTAVAGQEGSGVQVQEGTTPGAAVQLFGKGYLLSLQSAGCAEDPECFEPLQADMAKLGCEAFTRFEALNMLGAICFAPALTSMDFGVATVQTFRSLQRQKGVRGVSVNARVALDPKDPDAVWGFWRPRQPRERPRWGWGRSPTPSPPPKNNPSPGNGGNGGNNNNPPPSGTNPEPVPAGPQPDPSVYNWGLDRSNQQEGSLDKHNGQCPSRGSGVTVFILDTGCRTTHQELRGRATTEPATVDGYAVFESGIDGHGHGTHCAGSAAGKNVGIAPGATVRCIKVLNNEGSGMLDHVIAGLNMVAAEKRRSPSRAMVASLSLGAPASTAGRVNDAVNALSQVGVPVVVAAGNSNMDASTTVPASADGALTVGAIDERDGKASYSNYGSDLEIYAPGSNIYSASNTGDAQYRTMSGTSMATPAVAGGVACLMAADPARVCSTKDQYSAQRLADAMASFKSPGRRFGDLQIDQKIFYIPSDRNVVCPDTSF